MILTMTVKPNRIQNFDINTDRSITKLWGHDAFIVAFLDFSGKRIGRIIYLDCKSKK